MKVNPRKPIRLKNTSKYWNRETCKTHVTFSSPESYQSFKIKQEGYETRLYWQYKYCEDHNGQTFYYTLTYNDEHVPKYLGYNCFDYEDLRDLLTGGLRKFLLRKYGTRFKYFIGAELGDGKGERGLHNNPHYHVLFFLEDAKDARFPYVKISPCNFRHLVRMYWQGFDEDVTGFQDYRTALYGIAREGENDGLVTDFRACVYCAKYVVKDAGLKQREIDVERLARLRLRSELRNSAEFNNWFFDNYVMKFYKTSYNFKGQVKARQKAIEDNPNISTKDLPKVFPPTRIGCIDYLLPGIYDNYAFVTEDLTLAVLEFCRKFKFWKEYNEAFKQYLDDRVKDTINEYRNRYCNKPRISHGVGDYALDFVEDKFNPTFKVPDKDGFKMRPMSMYYYRKMFTDVYVDKKGSPIRVLNSDGIEYKVARLHASIDKMAEKAKSNLNLVLQNKVLFEKMRSSDVNTDVTFSYSDLQKCYNSLLKDFSLDIILQRYGQFKLVYEDRYFPYDFSGIVGYSDFPDLSVFDDYRRFLQPSYFTVSRSDLRLDAFLENGCPDCLPYSSHPYFLRFLGLFNVLDLCADYFFIQADIKNQQEAEEIKAVKRYHDKKSLKTFYSQFQ